MTAMSDEFWSSVQGAGSTGTVKLREAYWGFALTETTARADRAEMLTKLIGLGLFPCAGAWVAFTGVLNLPFGLAADIGTFIAFALVGFGLFLYASRGLRRALQVDTAHGVFRLGTENKSGSFSESGKFPFKSVESIFLMRENGSGSAAKLHLRLKTNSEPVFVLSGPERVLVPVLERTTESVRRSKGSRRARTKTTGRYMHVSFS